MATLLAPDVERTATGTLPAASTFAELAAEFRALAAAGVLNLRSGRQEPLSPSTVDATLSSVRQALLFMLRERRPRLTSADAARLLETEDIRPLLPRLADASQRRADAEGHQRSRNARNDALRFARVLFPAGFSRPRASGGTDLVPATWRPVLDAVEAVWTNPQTRRQYRSDLARLARLTYAAGYDGPAVLPARPKLEEILTKAGLARRTVKTAFLAYRGVCRHLREHQPHLRLTPVHKRIRPDEHGLRTLPRSAFTKLSADVEPANLTNSQLLPYAAGGLADAFTEWLENKGATRRPATRRDVERALCTVAAALVRAPQLLGACLPLAAEAVGEQLTIATLLPTDLFERHVLLSVAPSGPRAGAMTAARPAAPPVRDGGAEGGARAPERVSIGARALGKADVTVQVPLLWALVDAVAPRARAASPLDAHDEWFPPSLIKVCESLWMLTADLCEAAYRADAPHRWSAMRSQYLRLWKRMESANEATAIWGAKNKPLLIRTVTLPHVVCVILPRLASRVRRLEDTLTHFEAEVTRRGGTPARHPKCKRLRREWEDRLEEYLALAVGTADPVRCKNLAFCRVGAEADLRPVIEYDESGVPVRIQGVTSHFSGGGGANPDASLKVPDKGERLWGWSPAMIDLELLRRYVVGPRRDRIVAQQLFRDADGAVCRYDYQAELASGTLALFVSPDSSRADGAYASDRISDLYGRALHDGCRSVLRRAPVPAEYEDSKRGEWRALFAIHITRLLWATYWLGIRGHNGPTRDAQRFSGVQIAIDATTDSEETLADEYTVVAPEMRHLMRVRAPGDVDHPQTFDVWMDRAYFAEEIDWATEPLPIPPHMGEAPPPPEPRARRARQGRKPAAGD